MPPVFTAHNIAVPGGGETLPGAPLVSESPQMLAALRTMRLAFRGLDPAGVSVIDVGCLEGGYTVEFARAGFDAIGLEVRSINIEKCKFVADSLALPNLRFVEDDARNIEQYGPVDAVFCSGLLYHLDQPVEYLHTLARCTRRLLILQTHFAARRRPPLWRVYRPYNLSRVVTNEGQRGRWFREFRETTDQQAVERSPWASYGNARSFWPFKADLLQSMRDAGFASVYEQYDYLTDVVHDPYIKKHHRSMFIGVKETN